MQELETENGEKHFMMVFGADFTLEEIEQHISRIDVAEIERIYALNNEA